MEDGGPSPDALRARWNKMLAQAMRFAAVGTYAEAVDRAEQIVLEASAALPGLDEGPTRLELEALAAQAESLVIFWRRERLAKRARSLARGSNERQRELTPPDYEKLMEARASRRGSSSSPPTR